MRFLPLALLFCGEALVIFAEELGAKLYASSSNFFQVFLLTLVPLLIGAIFLVVSYMFGLRYFHNIWIVTAVSFGSILLVEPLFNFFYIGQTPTSGAAIGAVLGFLGILSSLFL